MNTVSGVTIRRAREADIPALAALIGKLFRLERDFSADRSKQEAGLRALLAIPERAAVFVAENGTDRTPVGMVTVQLTISTAEGGFSGLLEDLFVKPEFRRRGLAASLVAAVEAWCGERNCRRIQLLADRTNRGALEFYGSVGYGETSMICRRRFIE